MPRCGSASLSLTARTSLIALGQSTVKGGQVLATVLLVRLLSPEEWSRLALLLSVYLAGLSLGTLNFHQGIVFFAERTPPGERRSLVTRTAVLLGVNGMLTASVVLAVAPLLGGRLALGSQLAWVALALVMEIPTMAATQSLVADGRLRGAAAWDAATSLVQLLALCTPAVLGFGASGVVRGLALYAAVRLVAFVILTARGFNGPWWTGGRNQLWAQVTYSLPLGLALATSVLNRSVDKWFVAMFASGRLGQYAVAAQEIPLLSVLPYAVGTALAVQLVGAFAADDQERARQLWRIQTASMSLVIVPVAVGLVLCAPELFRLAFTESYAGAVLPFQIFTVILLHRVAEYGLILRAANRQRELLWASVVLLACNIIAGAPLTKAFGAAGASTGTLIANAVAWFFVLHRIARVLDVGWRQAFAWDVWVPVTAACCALAVAVTVVVESVRLGVAMRLIGKGGLFAFGALVLVRGFGWHRRIPPL